MTLAACQHVGIRYGKAVGYMHTQHRHCRAAHCFVWAACQRSQMLCWALTATWHHREARHKSHGRKSMTMMNSQP